VDGVLVIDKPAGMTSHDVVDRVRGRLGTNKVGHAGTLDPGATGLLVIGVGRATRLLSYAQQTPKRYRAEARFGVTTTTQDASGEVTVRRPASVTRADLEKAVERFIGEVKQVPPMVSAVKVGGERLYKKARRGEDIERAPRLVTVYATSVIDFDAHEQTATLDVTCSAGTYVRTLVHDIGEELGCGAHLAALRRTENAGFVATDAIDLADVDVRSLRPMTDAVRGLSMVEIDESDARLVATGRPLPAPGDVDEGEAIALSRAGMLLAVYRRDGEELLADRVLAQ
jgi:tRNA pseudouridine55 synthase